MVGVARRRLVDKNLQRTNWRLILRFDSTSAGLLRFLPQETMLLMKSAYFVAVASCLALLHASTVAAFGPPPSSGVIVNETFDAYADQASFEAIWQPTVPATIDPNMPPPPYGVLIPSLDADISMPNGNPPGLQGKAAFIQNRLNVYTGPALAEMQTLAPTIESPIRLSADIFDDAVWNKRVSVGLRSSGDPRNIIELGRWNAQAMDPTGGADPTPSHSTAGFAYRVMNFGPVGPPLMQQPNFQYFPLAASLDRPNDADALVTPADIAPGWHRYSATIGVNFVTLMLDLFRDGIDNATGLPGVDSVVTWQIEPRMNAPFDDLRIGAPSGITSVYGAVIDNVVLERLNPIPEPAALSLASLAAIALARTRRRR